MFEVGFGIGALGRVSYVGLVKAEHKGKGSSWENGGSDLGLGVGVGINIGALKKVSQLGLLIRLGFRDLPVGLACGSMVSLGESWVCWSIAEGFFI